MCFLGRNVPPADEDGLQFARATKEAALKAVLLTGIDKASLDLHPLNWPLIEEVRARLTPQQKYIRGLFCGGTLCDEAMFAALEKYDDVYSNIQPHQPPAAGGARSAGGGHRDGFCARVWRA